jgi:hypothetical protein
MVFRIWITKTYWTVLFGHWIIEATNQLLTQNYRSSKPLPIADLTNFSSMDFTEKKGFE